ncbi:alpha/beta hydrolase fold domain-containing protein [Sphingomonas histidinilytica]|jgi:acetyl esterase|uniref:Acetyl esterase n=1 Tax=Rhizorhabdus histidinilytica TaxID=439228 RepID=A0A1T5B1G4_9SPHN|nr:alpha/beta hydrolase [Rhizorhabdus histidinilytica]MBO9377808.1 alpha/beta hydrolase fold domain-containing protein [Rhizorhabdus histidinilytica]QEH79482.1 alpha/beta hydrolase [Sphingomonas sp. C8-2]SKB40713.1 acetyl esterase [Rhizorhabdus histidinilytica]
MNEEFVRPDVRAFLDDINNRAGPKTYEVDPPAAREMSARLRVFADVDSPPITTREDLFIATHDGRSIPARFYDPRPERDEGPLVVFFHGGGFVLGDIELYDAAAADIAIGLDLPVLSIDYRLAPEHPWPAGPDDCEDATRWVAEQGMLFGRRFNALALCGDSGGGTLSIVTAMALRNHPAALPVIAIWPLYPAVDLRKRYPSTERLGEGYMLNLDTLRWFNGHYAPDFNHWRASPRLGDQRGMPPALVVTATLDPLLDQGRAYAMACIEAGVPVVYREAKGNIHGWLTLRRAIPSSEDDLRGCLTAFRMMIEEYRP